MELKTVKRSKRWVWVDASLLTPPERKWLKRESKKYERKQFRDFKRKWRMENDFMGYVRNDFWLDLKDMTKL